MGRVFIVRCLRFICGIYTKTKVVVWTVLHFWGGMRTRRYRWTPQRRQNISWVGSASSVWWIFSENFSSLERERDQERLSFKEVSIFQPLRQVRILTERIQQTGELFGRYWGAIWEWLESKQLRYWWIFTRNKKYSNKWTRSLDYLTLHPNSWKSV